MDKFVYRFKSVTIIDDSGVGQYDSEYGPEMLDGLTLLEYLEASTPDTLESYAVHLELTGLTARTRTRLEGLRLVWLGLLAIIFGTKNG